MTKIHGVGFGYIPEETKHHYLIRIPRNKKSEVMVYERFEWDDGENQSSDITFENTKVILDRHKWDLVETAIQNEFNRILREDNITVGRFKMGEVPIERLLGKEMIVLLWAIEDSDPSLIPAAIRNWLGFSREEKWWLFTMTNAATGHADDKMGWRKAIRYAITENPIEDKSKGQMNLFSL